MPDLDECRGIEFPKIYMDSWLHVFFVQFFLFMDRWKNRPRTDKKQGYYPAFRSMVQGKTAFVS
ncbi:MAG: hypothetical protein A4E42_01996 [Methanoregulaceae archaeon PtaU1.Bin222]|nr:MAG: hypothetical protein A4E42_01996 [Methanoregulaceae archaeon PtaU1.Bin222]